jgi:uncharacterized membrane protein YdjX (TVP38/TMEM64 family)
MQDNQHLSRTETNKSRESPSRRRTLIFISQICFVLILLIIWFASEGIRESKNLWVLFFCSFPTEFLIAIVPHEPILLYFGKFYMPLTVALVAGSSTLMTEALNYSVFKYVTDLKFFKNIQQKKTVSKIVGLFNRAPFLALWIAAFTPIPFYPFRFLVVLARYPLAKYILALSLSRIPRFFILAFFGHIVQIPDYLLLVLFIVLIAAMNLPLVMRYLRNRRQKREDAL